MGQHTTEIPLNISTRILTNPYNLKNFNQNLLSSSLNFKKLQENDLLTFTNIPIQKKEQFLETMQIPSTKIPNYSTDTLIVSVAQKQITNFLNFKNKKENRAVFKL